MSFRPVTLTIQINSEAELRALHLRANLGADNIKSWYHDHRQRPAVILPDAGTKDLYKATKQLMTGFGLTIEDPNYRAPAPAPTVVRAGAVHAAF